jgi:hypothetical protein
MKFSQWLADAVLDSEDVGIGLPPSVLGANYEAIGCVETRPCPVPDDKRLRIVNLWHGETAELMIVNPTGEAIEVTWRHSLFQTLRWQTADSHGDCGNDTLTLPARGWVHCLGRG